MADDVKVATAPAESSAADMLNLDDAAFGKMLGLDQAEPPVAEEVTAPETGTSAVAEEVRSDEADDVVEGEGEGEDEGEEPAKPAEAPKPETEAPKPLTAFKVLDAEGEFDIPPGIEIEFKANGKVRREPLDKVVLLAQQGVYGSERLAQVNAIEAAKAAAEAEAASAKKAVETYEAHFERLLRDPEFYERAAQRYAETQTPEARADRAEREARQVREQATLQAEASQIERFVEQTLKPEVEGLLRQYPKVSEQEVMEQFGRLTAPLLQNGRLPTTRLSEVQRLVEGDLAAYVRARHLESLDTPEKATVKEGKKADPAKVSPEKRELVRAKRTLARAVSPRPAAGDAPPPKPKVYESAQDWFAETFKE